MYMYKLQWMKTDMLATLSFWSSNRLSLFIFVGLGTWCTTCKDSDRRDNDGSPVVAKEGHRAGQRAKVHLNKAMNQIKQMFCYCGSTNILSYLFQVYNDGIRNINLRFILTKLCAPVIGVLGMSLSVPYVVARSIVPFLGRIIIGYSWTTYSVCIELNRYKTTVCALSMYRYVD